MKQISELLDEVDVDSKIDHTNLEAEIINCTRLIAKWLRLYNDYKTACIRGESMLADMVVEKQMFYSGNGPANEYRINPRGQQAPKNQSQMEKMIDGDPDLCGLREKVDTAIQGKDICREMLDSLKYRPNSLKTVHEVRKFQACE